MIIALKQIWKLCNVYYTVFNSYTIDYDAIYLTGRLVLFECLPQINNVGQGLREAW